MIEDNTQMISLDPRMILVDGYDFQIGAGVKLGADQEAQALFMGTFTGRMNNTDERVTYSIAMDPMDAWEMFGGVLNVFEQVAAKTKGAPVKGGNRAARRRRKR